MIVVCRENPMMTTGFPIPPQSQGTLFYCSKILLHHCHIKHKCRFVSGMVNLNVRRNEYQLVNMVEY